MCRLQLFCCDFSLKSAAIVASVITAIVTAAYFIAALYLWGIANQIKGYDGANTMYSVLMGGGFGVFILGIVALGILLCLIRAIIKKNPVLLFPWIIGDMINIVLECITLLALFILTCTSMPACLPLFGIQAAWVSFELYVWIAMLSYYNLMKEEQKNLVPPYQSVQQNVPPNCVA